MTGKQSKRCLVSFPLLMFDYSYVHVCDTFFEKCCAALRRPIGIRTNSKTEMSGDNGFAKHLQGLQVYLVV